MRDFPILDDSEIKSIPWAVMVPHEQSAFTRYRRTLKQLADCGGVTPAEALAIIENRMWLRMPALEAREQLLEYCVAPDPSDKTANLQEAINIITRLRNIGDINVTTRHHFNKLLILLDRAK